jgi:outer membrane protein OmpA-like peptidoglycan-associated protein
MKLASFITLFLVASVTTWGQAYSTTSKKAIKNFEEARGCYELMDDACVEAALLKAIKADSEFVEAYRMMAQLKFDRGEMEQAISYFATSLELDPQGNPDGYRLMAGLTIRIGDYTRTLEYVDTFLSFPPHEVRNRKEAVLLREKCLFALKAMENPVPFEPENLGEAINSEYSEYWPSLSVDEQNLMFTVLLPVDPENETLSSRMQEDFFFSTRSGDQWEPRKNAGTPLNTLDNEGAHTKTADGRILYFTACNRRDGKGMCDLYQSSWTNGTWSVPTNLGAPVNTRFSEKHPTISADGRRLYFTSTRPGGLGSYDIWVSTKVGDSWSDPVNLGDSVNTPGVEQSPFIHPDQQSLYFSSTGWPGMGQGDLFLTKAQSNGLWSLASNLGYPINTHNDEIGLTVNARGNRAYFASDRGGRTDTDLYTFELPPEIRPVPVSYMNGRVFDSGNMKGLRAVLQLIDLETEEAVMELESQQGKGDYLISLPTDRDYALNVSLDGYLFYSENFTFSGIHSALDPQRRDIPLDRITAGRTVVLHNVFFETESFALQNESLAELNKVYEFLEHNPSIQVEIGGHTDNTGSPQHNMELSEQRAEAVVDYLVIKGIQRARLQSEGYGEEVPVAENDKEEGKKLNRRTELKILSVQ